MATAGTLMTTSSLGNELYLVLHLCVFGPDRAFYLLSALLDFDRGAKSFL